MKPMSKDDFKKLYRSRVGDEKKLPPFKVVRGFSHVEDVHLKPANRRTCVGIFFNEVQGPTRNIFFQVTNRDGHVWNESPHLYLITQRRLLDLIDSGKATPSEGREGKWEVPVELCKVMATVSEIESLDDPQFFGFDYMQEMQNALRMEMSRHQLAIDNIIRKYGMQ